jgi:hypothetical protein
VNGPGPCIAVACVVLLRPSEGLLGAHQPASSSETRRPGCNPVFQNIGARSAARSPVRRSVPGLWTDSKPATRLCAPASRLSPIASTLPGGANDGFQPDSLSPSPATGRSRLRETAACQVLIGGREQ